MIQREPRSTDHFCIFCEEYFEFYGEYQLHNEICVEAKTYEEEEEEEEENEL